MLPAFLAPVLLLAASLVPPLPASAGIFPPSAFSDKAAGATSAVFLKTPVGARGPALGCSAAAAVDGAESLFWNPAGLSRMGSSGLSEFSAGYNALLETSYTGAFAYARPLSDHRGTFGASLVYFSQSAIQGYTPRGDPSSPFTPNDIALSGAYARTFGSAHAGAALKVVRSELAGESGSTFALDFGVQAERLTDISEGALDLGAAVQNLGPALKLGSVSDPLPFKITGGAVWHINPSVIGLLDIHAPVDADPYASLGMEFGTSFGPGMKAALRGGYNIKQERAIDGLTGLSGGFGVDLLKFRLDYAWVPLGELGTTHRVSLAFRF